MLYYLSSSCQLRAAPSDLINNPGISSLIDKQLSLHHPLNLDTPPTSWTVVFLNQIALAIQPGFASGKHNLEGTGIPHLRPMNIDREGKIDLAVVKSVVVKNDIKLENGDILFNNTNSAELIGKTALISSREHGFAFSNHMTKICLEDHLSKSFLAKQIHFLWMSGYFKYHCTHHVNQASISSKNLADTIPLLLPPIREQTRVVEKLEELLSDLDAGVAELKTAQKKVTQYRQSLLKAAVEGALTAEWRAKHPLSPNPSPTRGEGNQVVGEGEVESENSTPLPPRGRGAGGEGDKITGETGAQLLERILAERRRRWEEKQLAKFKEQGKTPPKDWRDKYPEPVKPNTADLSELPEGWVWASLGQLVTESCYGTSVKCDYLSTGIPVLRIPNVVGRRLDLSDLKFATETLGLSSEDYLKVGDILVVRTNGSINLVGRAAVVNRPLISNYYFASYLLRLRFIFPSILPSWISAYLASNQGRRWIERRAASSAGQHNISLSTLLSMTVPLPPLTEQNEALTVLESQLVGLEDQDRSIDFGLKQSSAQRQNILKAAFSGQLVPQDPKDEPASVLLERIRAERAARESGGRRRGRKAREDAA